MDMAKKSSSKGAVDLKKAGKQRPKATRKPVKTEQSKVRLGVKKNAVPTNKVTKTFQIDAKHQLKTQKADRERADQLHQELDQRNNELAILNSVGEAMAKTLDVKTVTKIVGDKVRDIFNAEGVSI